MKITLALLSLVYVLGASTLAVTAEQPKCAAAKVENWTIDHEWFISKVTIKEVEKGSIYKKYIINTLEQKDWADIKSLWKEGDEIWYFHKNQKSDNEDYTLMGYALIRNCQIVHFVQLRLNGSIPAN